MASGKGIGGTGIAMFGSLMVVATIAVIVSQRAHTALVLQALGSGVTSAIGAAVKSRHGGR